MVNNSKAHPSSQLNFGCWLKETLDKDRAAALPSDVYTPPASVKVTGKPGYDRYFSSVATAFAGAAERIELERLTDAGFVIDPITARKRHYLDEQVRSAMEREHAIVIGQGAVDPKIIPDTDWRRSRRIKVGVIVGYHVAFGPWHEIPYQRTSTADMLNDGIPRAERQNEGVSGDRVRDALDTCMNPRKPWFRAGDLKSEWSVVFLAYDALRANGVWERAKAARKRYPMQAVLAAERTGLLYDWARDAEAEMQADVLCSPEALLISAKQFLFGEVLRRQHGIVGAAFEPKPDGIETRRRARSTRAINR